MTSGMQPLSFGSPLVDTFNWQSVARAAATAAQINTPVKQQSARGGADPLDTQQRAAVLGESIPIVFCRRVGNVGGIVISPAATEARFTNNAGNDVTVSYRLVLSEGIIDPIQVRDVFQQSCRVGTFTQAYDRPAGAWVPGNFLVKRGSKPLPEATIYCGTNTGSYKGLSVGSFVNTIPDGFDQYNRQVHLFVRGGINVYRLIPETIGSTNNVADLVLYLLRRTSRVPDGLIDLVAMREAALFTRANGLNCDIELKEPSNLADFLSQILPYFLLRESRRQGKRGLRPLLPVNDDGSIKLTQIDWRYQFTDDDVNIGSLQIDYINREQRKPFTASIIWRQQPADTIGLARTSEVKYRNANPDDPIEQHDLSAFCTSERHAVRVGAYILSRRRHITHQLTIDVSPGPYLGTLAPGDIVRLTLTREESNGTTDLHDYLYEVDRIGNSRDGWMTLELTHFPVDNEGRSLVALDVSGAKGSGVVLDSGRADVNCDANSVDDESVEDDDGPPEDWEEPEEDLPVYGDLEDDDWEYDEEDDEWIYVGPDVDDWEWDEEEQEWKLKEEDWEWDQDEDKWDYIGPELEDWEWDKENQEWDYVGDEDEDWEWDQQDQKWDYIGPELEDWEWDRDNQEWDWIGEGEPGVEPDGPPAVPPDGPPAVPPDGPPAVPPDGPPAIPPTDPPANPPAEKPFDPPEDVDDDGDDEWGDGPTEPDAPEIEDQSEYTGTVTLGTPVVRYPDVFYLVLQENFALVTMEVTVDEAPRFTNLQLTLSNAGVPVPVTIPVGQTRAVVNMNGSGTSLSGCTTRTVSIVGHSGGGYAGAGLDTSAETTYQVCGYQGQITLSATTWTREDDEWVPSVEPDDWTWDGTAGEWDYAGDAVEDWAWDAATQEWEWEGVGAPENRPALPPAIPSSLPPEGATTTVVARAAVDVPPVPNSANNLEIDINDVVVDDGVTTQQAKGTIVIPAVSPVVDGWRYNYATSAWDIVTLPGNGYRWDGSAWVWLGVGDAPTAPTDEPPEEVPHADWVNTRANVGELTYHVEL